MSDLEGCLPPYIVLNNGNLFFLTGSSISFVQELMHSLTNSSHFLAKLFNGANSFYNCIVHNISGADLHKVIPIQITKWIPQFAKLFCCAVDMIQEPLFKGSSLLIVTIVVVSSFLSIDDNSNSAAA